MATVFSDIPVWRRRHGHRHVADRTVAAIPLADDLLLLERLLLVPSEQCGLMTLELPSRRRRDIEAALPFLLEEHMAQSPKELRWAWRHDGERVQLLVVDAGRLEQWRGLLPAGVDGSRLRLLPDIAALPYEEGRWSLHRRNHRLLVRTGHWSGLACTLDEAPALLRLLYRQSPPERGALLLEDGTGEGGTEALPLPEGLEIERRCDAFPWLTSAPRDLPLLPLVPQQDGAQGGGRRWWAAALLLLLAATGLHSLSLWRETSWLDLRRKELETQALQLFREAFPEVHRIVNPRIQARQRLVALKAQERRRAAGGLLPLLYRVGKWLRADGDSSILRLHYRAPALNVTLDLSDAEVAERLAAALTGEGEYQAEVISTTRNRGRTVARLRITRP